MSSSESSWSPGEIPDELISALHQCQNPLILTHIYPDGDALGSAISIHRLLKSAGKSPRTVLTHPVPDKLAFIDHDGEAEVLSENPQLIPEKLVEASDLVVVVDTSAPDRLGLMEPAVTSSEVPRICIDHHLEGAYEYFSAIWCEPGSPATGNLIYEVYQRMQIELDRDTAESIFVALATDTGWFRHSNAGFKAYEYAARLVQLGVEADPVYNRIFQSFSHERTLSLGDLLSQSVLSEDGKILYSVFTEEIRSRRGVSMEELDGFVDSLGQVKGAEIVFLVVEIGPMRYKVSLRSHGDFSVHAIATRFGGGGHAKAAGCRLEGTEDEVVSSLLNACRDLLGESATDPATDRA